MLLLYVLTYCCLISSVRAVCCSNHKALCFINSMSCTPNCPDKVSYCAPGKETCANNGLGDTWGKCIDIRTITLLAFQAKYTATRYTGTVTKPSSTQVFYTYNTQVTTVLFTDTRTATRTITSTTTTTVQPKIRLLAKRESTSTTTLTNYPCSTTRDDRCTTTLSLLYTQWTVATETRNSAVQSTFRSTVVTTTTIDSTRWVTATATAIAGKTTSIAPTGKSTSTVVVTATETSTDTGGAATASATPTGTLGTADNSAQRDTPMSTPSEGGQLSTGAKAAIGTTVSTVVIAIVGLFCLWRRKKKEKKAMYTPMSASPGYAHAQPQMVQPGPYQPYAAIPVRKPVPRVQHSSYAPLLPHTPAPMQQQTYNYTTAPQPYNYPAPAPPYNPYQYPYPEQTVYPHTQVSPIHEVYARPTYAPYSPHMPR